MLEELDVSFKEQSEKWLKWATTRSRKPILLTSVPTIRGALDNYILPRDRQFTFVESPQRKLQAHRGQDESRSDWHRVR